MDPRIAYWRRDPAQLMAELDSGPGGLSSAVAAHVAQAIGLGSALLGLAQEYRASNAVVLLRSDLDVPRRGVQDGRRTFANPLKHICITTSANFGNMLSMALVTPLLLIVGAYVCSTKAAKAHFFKANGKTAQRPG